METFKFVPLSNYVVVDIKKKKFVKGLAIPDTVKDPSMTICIVVAISDEKEKDGTPFVRNVKVGDNITFTNFNNFFVNVEGKDYLCVRETDVIGILKEEVNMEEFESIDLHPKEGSLVKPKSKLSLVN